MKRRWRKETGRLAAELLEVPKDILEHVPRIVVIGKVQVVIENYRTIVAFGSDRIAIATADGEFTIRGEGLSITTIVPEEIVVEGLITGLDID